MLYKCQKSIKSIIMSPTLDSEDPEQGLSNPDFASHLAFALKKHDMDKMRSTCMYHDMQTGRWWGLTAVPNQLVIKLEHNRH